MARKTRQGAARPSDAPAGNGGSDRRAQLLKIAEQLFAARGYAQTTVRDIADEAGILSGSIYHHFSSKEAMLDEILRGFLTNLLDTFQRIEKDNNDPRQALDELIAASFDAIATNPNAVALYQNQAGLLSNQAGFEYVAESSRKIERIWLRLLGSGQKAGVFRDDIDINLAYRFIRDTVWSTVRWYRPRGKYQSADIADQYLNVLHGGLLVK